MRASAKIRENCAGIDFGVQWSMGDKKATENSGFFTFYGGVLLPMVFWAAGTNDGGCGTMSKSEEYQGWH